MQNFETIFLIKQYRYIRAWNIENYCIHSPGRKNRRRQRAGALPKINITEDVVLSGQGSKLALKSDNYR